MSEMSMIERVARAIFEANPLRTTYGDFDSEPTYGDICMGYARAAIQEMREPTEAMVAAAHDAEADSGGIAPAEHHKANVRNIIVTAIDAALEE